MSFFLYLLGQAVLVGGIAWALITAGVATTYIAMQV